MRALLASLAVMWTSSVYADPPTVAQLVQDATKLYNVQQYDKAAELYQEAYLLEPRPEYLYASAQAQRLHGDCAKALLSYQAYLRANPPESERAKAEKNIQRCEQDLIEREAAVDTEQLQAPFEVPLPPPAPAPEPGPPPTPPSPKSYVIGHALLGAGIVAIGGGGLLFYSGRSAIADHNAGTTYDAYLASGSDIGSAKQNQVIGLAVIGGGVALAGGAVLYYLLQSRADDEAPSVSASVSAEQASVTFTRSF